ncbi:hypothetical protein T484DRAFT_1776688 [Baffinella frigidus]|nr:hypothetical protein T484DRAFT_1776688 [Cryptophyta sp. CCMP2293]
MRGSHAGITYLDGEFGPSAIFIRYFRASSPEARSDVYNVGAAFSIQFSETTNRGGLPQTGVTKAQLDNLLGFSSDLRGDPHPLGLDYEGTWEDDDKRLVVRVTAVDPAEPKGPPPLSGGNFRVAIKASGDLRNVPPTSARTVIDDDSRAAKGVGGAQYLGMDCDCCRTCGTGCAVCGIYACDIPFGGTEEVCSSCCAGYAGEKDTCCRILSGNYGLLIYVMKVSPASRC